MENQELCRLTIRVSADFITDDLESRIPQRLLLSYKKLEHTQIRITSVMAILVAKYKSMYEQRDVLELLVFYA